jgi:two-component system sensor histidine kinase AauS
VRFLERGALDTASTNLKTINDLIDRMGRITASLRSFARRGDDRARPAWPKRWTPPCRCSAAVSACH